ncbi:uncharacterized protein LOC119369826 [Jatropha curcas]|uniref:uncharacterized protein LOC119369826 n=1 Tax=Jatropha curcas TaxID=180498 RepID=UPI0018955ED9|nr:uncharacterized protein LOC119369826 [Jatropha curcas]
MALIFQADVGQLLYRYKVEHHHSSPYRPQANGAVEAVRSKKILIQRCVERYRRLAEKLPFALWGASAHYLQISKWSLSFRTSIRNGGSVTDRARKKSLRVLVEAGLTEEEWVKKRYEDLALLDGRRLNARFQDQMRKRRIARFYNKRIHPRALKNRDLVLIRLLDHEAQHHPGGKFKPNWHGPFRIHKLLAKGAAE